jgi:signal transduction histidine kinase
MYDEDKNINAILVFGYEVTEQVKAKNKNLEDQKELSTILEEKIKIRTQELSKANEMLLQKNNELESFTFISSHDLQEPLRKIQTFCSRLLEKEKANLSETGKDYFQRMQSAAGRMQTLIDDLLAFSRLNSSERKFENSNLNTIIDEVKSDLHDTIIEKNAIIEETEICDIQIIPFQFRQLIHNLLSNALKFSKANTSPHIIIGCKVSLGKEFNNGELIPDRKYCHISISDNGIGFEQHFEKRVFEVFQKLHRREEYPGTGIGLAIVKKIVENHNGVVDVKSELDKGTTFNVYIPSP